MHLSADSSISFRHLNTDFPASLSSQSYKKTALYRYSVSEYLFIIV